MARAAWAQCSSHRLVQQVSKPGTEQTAARRRCRCIRGRVGDVAWVPRAAGNRRVAVEDRLLGTDGVPPDLAAERVEVTADLDAAGAVRAAGEARGEEAAPGGGVAAVLRRLALGEASCEGDAGGVPGDLAAEEIDLAHRLAARLVGCRPVSRSARAASGEGVAALGALDLGERDAVGVPGGEAARGVDLAHTFWQQAMSSQYGVSLGTKHEPARMSPQPGKMSSKGEQTSRAPSPQRSSQITSQQKGSMKQTALQHSASLQPVMYWAAGSRASKQDRLMRSELDHLGAAGALLGERVAGGRRHLERRARPI